MNTLPYPKGTVLRKIGNIRCTYTVGSRGRMPNWIKNNKFELYSNSPMEQTIPNENKTVESIPNTIQSSLTIPNNSDEFYREWDKFSKIIKTDPNIYDNMDFFFEQVFDKVFDNVIKYCEDYLFYENKKPTIEYMWKYLETEDSELQSNCIKTIVERDDCCEFIDALEHSYPKYFNELKEYLEDSFMNEYMFDNGKFDELIEIINKLPLFDRQSIKKKFLERVRD